MDWKQVLSLPFDELTDLKRDEIYENLIELRRSDLDKKHHKKLIDLMQHILHYKGDLVNQLLTELEAISTKDMPHINTDLLLAENAQLKDMVAKLEADKTKLKSRLGELTDENAFLLQQQRRPTSHHLLDASSTPGGGGCLTATTANNSDGEHAPNADSPDRLSELDKQEQLLANISAKNKHIKRLLRDIDTLESQATTGATQIHQLRVALTDATAQVHLLDSQLAEHKRQLAERDACVDDLRQNVRHLGDQLGVMEQQRDEREHEIQTFGQRLEERAIRWREMLSEKDDRLDSLRTKYESVLERGGGGGASAVDADRLELQRLAAAVGQRETMIGDLEEKIAEMSREMCDTTEMMMRLAKEREGTTSESGRRAKCDECARANDRAEAARARCAELQDLVAAAEEESAVKARQATDAMIALEAFKSGADGLVQALRRNSELQSHVRQRDRQVVELVAELNGMHRLAQENSVMRKQLGIGEDELLACTRSLAAKQKRRDKLAERLALKLRASEEMRLQLKLEKNDLRRQLADVQMCEHCARTMAGGRLQQTTNQQSDTMRSIDEHQPLGGDLSERYAIVIEENENLRVGMHEILEQLRSYDAEASHIVIDTPTLKKLLHALDARSVSGWYHPAMRMQQELVAVKERELALKERCRLNVAVVDEAQPNDGLQQVFEKQTSKEPQIPPTAISPSPNFDSLVQRLTEQEAELASRQLALEAAVQLQRETAQACENLQEIENQFHDLTEMLAGGDDEQVAELGRRAEELVELRNQLNVAEKKRQYAEEDYRLWREQQRGAYERISCALFEVRKELTVAKSMVTIDPTTIAQQHPRRESTGPQDRDTAYLKLKCSKFAGQTLQHFAKLGVDPELNIDYEKLARIAVIQEDCTVAVDFVTRSEIDQLRNENQWLAAGNGDLQRTNRHLEDLLQLTQDQLRQQQTLLNEPAEEAITLRHLVVDLQSDGQEKFVIARMGRELQQALGAGEELKRTNQRMGMELDRVRRDLEEAVERANRMEKEHQTKESDCGLKLKFLSKSHANLCEQFQKYTPLYPMLEFIQHYANVLDAQRQLEQSQKQVRNDSNEKMIQQLYEKVRESLAQDTKTINMEDKIDIIKYQNQNAYLKQQLDLANAQIDDMHTELKDIKLRAADWSQQWETIRLLFGPSIESTPEQSSPSKPTGEKKISVANRETQTTIATTDQCLNTDVPNPTTIDPIDYNDSTDGSNSEHGTFTVDGGVDSQHSAHTSDQPQAAPRLAKPTILPNNPIQPTATNTVDISLASQLKQAMALASARSALLLDTEHQLTNAQSRIKSLERSLQERDKTLRELRTKVEQQPQPTDNTSSPSSTSPRHHNDNILSVTIASLQGLLLEKDTAMSRYQDLLRSERDNRTAAYEEHRREVRQLQNDVDEQSALVRSHRRELETLRLQLQQQQQHRSDNELATERRDRHVSFEPHSAGDKPSTISDAFIENMFLEGFDNVDVGDEKHPSNVQTITKLHRRIQELTEETGQLHQKLREVSQRETIWERTLCDKDAQIAALKNDQQHGDGDTADPKRGVAHRDIEQLRDMLAEKDRHIADLTETLAHFHDDQQTFMTDTSLHSAEQVTQLSADVSRADATNRILTTQLDAVKRQLMAVGQREQQAREVIKTLKTQLIRRPVIAVKSTPVGLGERPSTGGTLREDQLHKRLGQQDAELQQLREELRKQTAAAQSRRTKDAAELALWNKHKRAQQLAEQLRQRLEASEADAEKVRGHLASAKAAIGRLEREKHLLEQQQRRNTAGGKLCHAPSCPNIHVGGRAESSAVSTARERYNLTPAETPDAAMMEYVQQQAPLSAESQPSSRSRQTGVQLDISDGNQEVIDALRVRIEQQQRRIVAMELEGRGATAIGGELERWQERVGNVEAMNIRLEARNLNLQLELDMLRQGDQGEKTRRQIKHLEDYILALKTEHTQTRINADEMLKSRSNAASGHSSASQQQYMEQTILSMRRIVERLKFENKQLKDGKSTPPNGSGGQQQHKSASAGGVASAEVKQIYEKMRIDLERTQQSYADALDKISELQIELDIQRGSGAANADVGGSESTSNTVNTNNLDSLKEKLIRKTQLLEKAKILLGRAAAKEKQFREQIVYWKRRCAELQNVPVIEETSE